MAKLHIIEGPVGAGKTTYANKLGRDLHSAPLVLDEWMATLFRPDRPDGEIWEWYGVRKQRCIEQIWRLAQAHIASGGDAIVELGLIQRAARHSFYERVEKAGLSYCVHVLEVEQQERQRRVKKRNTEQGETFAMEVSDEVFAMASSMWEPIDDAECKGREVVFA